MITRALPVLAITALTAALSAACGSSAGTPEQLEQAVRSYSAAFLSGQGEKAAGMLSQRCGPQLHQQTVQAASMAPALYGQAKLVSVQPVVDGDHGSVTYRFDQPAIDQENQRWVWGSGAWHYDQC